jgi:MFS family permease
MDKATSVEMKESDSRKLLSQSSPKASLPKDERTLDEKVDTLLQSVSGPLTHLLIFFAVSGGITAILVVMNNIALFEVVPHFKCAQIGSDEVFECVEANFCGNPDITFWVDREHPDTIYNWAEQIGLICRPGWQVGMLGSVYFGGWCSSLLWMPQLSDRIGRKTMFVYSLAMSVVLYTVMMFTRSFKMMVLSIFLQGFFNSAKIGVGWPYLIELVPISTRSTHAAAFGVVGASFGIIGALFFIFVSKNGYLFCAIGYVF